MKNLIFVLPFIFLFVHCNKENNETNECCLGSDKGHFILSYIDVDSLAYDIIYYTSIENSSDNPVNYSDFRINIIQAKGNIYDYREDSVEFQNYAEKYGDTSFIVLAADVFSDSPCIIDTISNISITCKQRYNLNFPENSIINEIVDIKFTTARSFLERSDEYNGNTAGAMSVCVHEEKLNEFNSEENWLLGFKEGIGISLSTSPDKTGLYEFSVKLTEASGRQFNIDLEPLNIKGVQ